MAVNLSPVGGVAGQFFDNNGNPLAGGKIFTYAAGTTTNQATYTSASGAIAHSNPIILDGAGRVPSGEIWLTDGLEYKFVIKDSVDALIGTFDNITGINSNFVNFTNEQEIQTATVGQTVFNLTTMQYQPGTNSLSVFVDGVNQYGPGALYAYVETDSDTVTFTAGLHVGAEVKFTTSQLNSSAGGDAFQVSYTPPFTGSIATNVGDKLAQTVSVKDFGAVGDGIADDTAAIQAAIVSGEALFWPEGNYLITSEIDETINFAINWSAQNAKITYDPPAITQNVIKLTVYPYAHQIEGLLTIECDKKAFNGIYLLSPAVNLGTYPEGYPDLTVTDLRVYRPYRASTAFSGGNAILIEGGWNNVVLVRPHAVECTMATGAGISGSEGIFGISVLRIGSSTQVTPHNIVIEDAFIDTVVSDDSTYQFDQEGIRAFTSYDAGVANGTQFTYTIRGGVIRNCRNRGVKGQANLGRVNDVTFIRTNALGGPNLGLSGEINEQIGSVSSSGCEFFYEDYVPAFLFFSRTRVEGYKQPSSTITNVRGVVTGSTELTALFAFTVESSAPALHRVSISNVDFNGSAERLLQTQSSTVAPNAQNIFNVTNAVGIFSNAAIRDSGGGGFVRWNLLNCSNLSGTDVLVMNSDGATIEQKNLSCTNLFGFLKTGQLRYNPSAGDWPNAQLTNGFVPEINEGIAGILLPVAFTLAQNEIYELPANSSAATTSGLMLITTSRAAFGSQAMFQLDQAGVYLITTSAQWAAGTTSEPVSGDFRMWIDSVSLRVKVSNRTATTRTFTAWMLG
jgi:hypothetical protein